MSSTFGDLGSAVVIIFIFTIIHGVLAVSIGIANIRNNWDYYKCNPAVMPFAGVFGHDIGKNFNECVKLNQVDFMSVFLDPIYEALLYFSQNGSVFASLFERLKLFGNLQGESMFDFTFDANARLNALADGGNRIFIGINDTFSKLASTITILFYVIQSGIVAGRSAWNELPGTFIKVGTFGAIS